MMTLLWVGLAVLAVAFVVGVALGSLSTTGDGGDVIQPEDVMATMARLEREMREARR